MVKAQKVIDKLIPYILEYSKMVPASYLHKFLQDIVVFCILVHNKTKVSLDVWYLRGGSRQDYIKEFPTFVDCWMYLIKHYHTLQNGGFNICFEGCDVVFVDALWSSSDPTMVSESETPLSNFVIDELIKYSERRIEHAY